MPPIKRISFDNGILIEGDGIPSVNFTFAQFPSSGNLSQRETRLNQLVQRVYEDWVRLDTLDPADPVRQTLPTLLVNERIERQAGVDYLVTTVMWAQVHVFSVNPWRYTIRCQNPELGPIAGEWWL